MDERIDGYLGSDVPFNRTAAVAVVDSIREHAFRYQSWRDNADVRSHASDQLHTDCGFLLWVVDKLMPPE